MTKIDLESHFATEAWVEALAANPGYPRLEDGGERLSPEVQGATHRAFRALSTTWVIYGSYQKVGDQIRVTANIYDSEQSRDNESVQAKGPLGDIFGIVQVAQHTQAGCENMPVVSLEKYCVGTLVAMPAGNNQVQIATIVH